MSKLQDSFAWLKKRYIDESKTPEQMAAEAKCSALTIRRRLKEHKLIK